MLTITKDVLFDECGLEMSLKTVGGKEKLCVSPAKEIELLYNAEKHFSNIAISADQPSKHQITSKCYDITLSVPMENSFVFILFGFGLNYDTKQSILKCRDKGVPLKGENGVLTIRLVIDTISAEIFADNGSIFIGMAYIQDYNLNTLTIGAESFIESVDIRIAEVKPFWEEVK